MLWRIKANKFFRYLKEEHEVSEKQIRKGTRVTPQTWARVKKGETVSETTILKLILFLDTNVSRGVALKIKEDFLEEVDIGSDKEKEKMRREIIVQDRLYRGFLKREWTLKAIGDMTGLPVYRVCRFASKNIGLPEVALCRLEEAIDKLENKDIANTHME